jgi:hypothetical protein
MKYPQLLIADHVVSSGLTKKQVKDPRTYRDIWVAARPMPPSCGIGRRLQLAIGVFTGRYDAIKWKQQ